MSHTMAGIQVVSTHMPPTKARSLAVSLLRISERRGLQDDFIVENVVYCGVEEPLNGWTNTAPVARYSESSRPKGELPKRKRQNRKPKPLEAKESMSDIYDEFLWMATRADGHYHASATLQELYDEYKRRQRIDDHTKLNGMIDPVTFRYVPIDERDDGMDTDDISGIRLPVLKMTHANKQAKLLEVLENFMSRKSDNSSRTDTERYAVKGRDAASFYDKLYFKDKHGQLSRNMNIRKRGKRLGKRKPGLDAKSYYSESESEDSGGRRRPKRHSHPPTYVMQVKDEETKTKTEETVTFERKTDYALSASGGPGIARWVARVAIRETVSKGCDQSNTSTTASQITSKSSHEQIDILHRLRTKSPRSTQGNAKQPEYRLSNKRNMKSRGRRLPTSFYELYHLSAVETDKASMKYNVSISKQQGHARDESESPEAGPSNKDPPQVSKKKRVVKPTPVHSQKHIGSVNRLLPSTKKVIPLLKNSEGVETWQDGMKSPLPPIKSKRSPYSSDESSSKVSKVRKKFRSVEADKKLDREERALFAGKQTFESSEERQTKTPSSSTFNPDKMFQQMKDTADFITKAPMLSKHSKSIQTSPRMLSNIEETIDDGNTVTKSDLPTRKPLNPKQSKNRAQDIMQQIIDEENALVGQVIKQMNSNWKETHRKQLAPVPESSQDAISIAIAKSRLHDIQGNGIIPTSRRSSVNQVMKRRVVPPMKEKPSVPTTTVSSEENFHITDGATFLTTKPKLPGLKSNGRPKKLEARGPGLSKSFRLLSKDRNESIKANNKLQPGVHFASDGDFLITKPQSGIFEASISSIKPTRRIANVNQPFNIRQRA